MKKPIIIIFVLTAIIVGIYLIGNYVISRDYNNPSRTTITYTEDDRQSSLMASYPIEKSASVLSYIKTWSQTNSVLTKSGDTVAVTFNDGRNCKVYAKGRRLNITADRSKNSADAIEKFKADFRRINDYIVKQVSDSTRRQ
ncbi:hypothetical protein [Pedobacter sp. JY14-1]|uniref:hypothetical protein n=1 Tax=Pedobacter sp. JY14-1 TaxID=3034151 RepID=UPI0023E1F136|nr:hypothetical protein [Pedobacter sp. JY14-1]